MADAIAADGRIVIVGGGVGGAHACQQARRQGFSGSITLLSAEHEVPYDRPPLSKTVLAGTRDQTRLPIDYDALGIDVRTATMAREIQTDRRVVVTEAEDVRYDGLVIATGAAAVTLPGDGRQFTLRTRQDALELRERLRPHARVVIVGASWTGAEVATAALARRCVVSCVEASAAPLAPILGEEVAASLPSWWHEVDLRSGVTVVGIEDGLVHLSDGTSIEADVVVVGIGVRPQTAWLEGSGIELDRGVVVDDRLQSNAPGVVAVGDVAAWWSRRWQTRMRIAHWDDAVSGPATAVAALLVANDDRVHDPVPYFWSDQFGHKLQYVGHHTAADEPVHRGVTSQKKRSVAWLDPDGRLTALLAIDNPADVAQARVAIGSGIVPDVARLADPSTPIREL